MSKIHQTIGIVVSREPLTDARKEDIKHCLQRPHTRLIGITTVKIGNDTVTMFICVFPSGWNAMACNEYTCIDGWYLTLDDKFQITGHMK